MKWQAGHFLQMLITFRRNLVKITMMQKFAVFRMKKPFSLEYDVCSAPTNNPGAQCAPRAQGLFSLCSHKPLEELPSGKLQQQN